MPASSRLPRLRRAIRGVRRLSAREILTTLHAVAAMTVVELTVRWVSLPRLSRSLGAPLELEPPPSGSDLPPLEDLGSRATRQLLCTWRVAEVWPFSDGPCLRRSLVGGHLIRRMSPILRLGVVGDGDEVIAHAWLEIDGRPLEPVADLQPFHRSSDRVGK